MEQERANLERARLALQGLAVGDALGGFWEFARPLSRHSVWRRLPPAPWHYTDDTAMALSVFATLRERQTIDQDFLIQHLATHFEQGRGYGPGTRAILHGVARGEDWRELAYRRGETGSFGNGATPRAALVGAYFAEHDPAGAPLTTVVEQARLAAEVTHAHPEGIAGAVAVALAAAHVWRARGNVLEPRMLFKQILADLPSSAVGMGLSLAQQLPMDAPITEAVEVLGNGGRISCQDTVPLALWCAAWHLNRFGDAMWRAIDAGGDVDTIAAIAGSVVALAGAAIPKDWQQATEPLPPEIVGPVG